MNYRLNHSITKLHSKPWIIASILFVIAVVVSFQNIGLGVKNFWGGQYTHYNNYVIFKESFGNLIQNRNLYLYYPNDYADLFKYSPTFAMLMGVFYYLPNYIGLPLWNLLNIWVFFYAIVSFKNIEPVKKMILLAFVIFELILSTQNSQSNVLLAGLTILSFNMFEKGKVTWGAFFIVLGTFIKIYSIVGCVLILLYPNKLKSGISLFMWLVIFTLLPLAFIDHNELIWQYQNWFTLLKTDQHESIGMSYFEFTQFVLPANSFKSITLVFGALILLTPLLKFSHFKTERFRIQYLALILIWLVMFNYKAESPTFIIAMTGIGIWFFSSGKSILNLILILLCLLFTSIWCTDIVPPLIRSNFVHIKYLKPLLPGLVLIKVYVDLITLNRNPMTVNAHS